MATVAGGNLPNEQQEEDASELQFPKGLFLKLSAIKYLNIPRLVIQGICDTIYDKHDSVNQ